MTADCEYNYSTRNLIIGGGLTGLSAAYYLNDEYILVEGEKYLGGTSGTLSQDGFKLDKAVHILYFTDQSIKNWIANELSVPLISQKREARVWFEGKFIQFPLQVNLNQLPLAKKVKAGFSILMSINQKTDSNSLSFSEWAESAYGGYLYNSFYKPYNEKLFGMSADSLTTEWMGNYIPNPAPVQMIQGIFKSSRKTLGLNAEFYYPEGGGIDSLAKAIAKKLSGINFELKLQRINPDKKLAYFENGVVIRYKNIINTIPLNKMINCLDPVSDKIAEISTRLKYNATTILHLLVKTPKLMKGVHWIYVPQPDIPFYRITLAHNICEANCPEGWSALTLELGGQWQKSSASEEECLKSLRQMDLLKDGRAEIKFVWDSIACGYVVYDNNLKAQRAEAIKILKQYDIYCAGRYGRWEYSNMESAIIQGREISNRIKQRDSFELNIKQSSENTNIIKDYFANQYPTRHGFLAKLLFRKGESARVKQFKKFYPATEGKSILDIGCGDGLFLKSILNGMPRLLCLNDLVERNGELAKKNLRYDADEIFATTSDVINSKSLKKFDLVMAIGLIDYYINWTVLIGNLWNKCDDVLIFDIPKSNSLHNRLRFFYLNFHRMRLNHASQQTVEKELSQYEAEIDIVELKYQFMIKMKRLNNAG